MRYLLLIYSDEQVFERLPSEVQSVLRAGWANYASALQSSGILIDAAALQPTITATTLRADKRQLLIADGPFAETKEQLAATLMQEHPMVARGKMMSSPGIMIHGKVFAFFQRDEMVFRLGKDTHPAAQGLTHVRPLNLFKTRPPLAGWYCVTAVEHQRWEALARFALRRLSDNVRASVQREADDAA